ncbi:TlpA family protein disulfide reductase [Chryseobacterium gleum]|uniref:TlpA family protein disulfide reductase n=1 Tax=Chryseobacterium gleum TaxID=250 RepID=UPI00241D6264|nr:TlpA disulfide reductase family protein [Chryseobacterium gleum]
MKVIIKQKIYKASTILLLVIFHLTWHQLLAQDKMIKIQGTIKDLKDGDSVMMIRYQHQFLPPSQENEIVSYSIVKNKRFTFRSKSNGKVEKFKIVFPENLRFLNWEDGVLHKENDLKIEGKENKLVFKGAGSPFIAYQSLLDSLYKSNLAGIDWQGGNMEKNKEIIEAAIKDVQNTGKQHIRYNEPDFLILRLNKTISLLGTLYSIAARNGDAAKEFMRKSDAEITEMYLSNIFNSPYVTFIPSPALNGLMRSRFDCLFIKDQHRTKQESMNAYTAYLKKNLKEPVLAQMLTSFLYNNRNSDILTADYLDKIIKSADFSGYQGILQSIQRFSPGTVLPEFFLTDTSGNETPLNLLKGNVLVLDFWFTGCGACAVNYKVVKPIIKSFEGKPVKFISISRDKNHNLWLKSIRSGLYSDPGHVNLSAGNLGEYHPLFKYLQISGYPTFIIIDKEGKIIGSPKFPELDQGVDLKNKIQLELSRNY